MAVSVALVPVFIAVIGLVGVPFFRRVYRFDWATSWYAAMPGGLTDMVIFGQEAGGDVRALSLIHATRVLIIVTLAPLILTFGFGVTLDSPIGAPASELPMHEMLIMIAAAIIGWKLGERIGLFGAPILGPMILTGALSLLDVIHYRPPAEAILAAQFLIGLGIGVGYVGVTLREIRRDVTAGVIFVAILAILAALFTELVVIAGLAPPVDGFLAFAPGGQAEMTVLAIIVGADLGYVIVHHLTRVLLVITGAPLVARLMRLDEAPGHGRPKRKTGTIHDIHHPARASGDLRHGLHHPLAGQPGGHEDAGGGRHGRGCRRRAGFRPERGGAASERPVGRGARARPCPRARTRRWCSADRARRPPQARRSRTTGPRGSTSSRARAFCPRSRPGAFDAWMLMLRDHGRLPLAEVLAPAIHYAEHGHPMLAGVASAIAGLQEVFRQEWPTSAPVWLPGGRAPEAGALFRNPDCARCGGVWWRRARPPGPAARPRSRPRAAPMPAASWPRPSTPTCARPACSTPPANGARACSPGRTWRVAGDMGGAPRRRSRGLDRLEMRSLDTGPGAVAGPADAGGRRPGRDGPDRAGVRAPRDRGAETRLRRPRKLLRRPGAPSTFRSTCSCRPTTTPPTAPISARRQATSSPPDHRRA
jgi:membrane AbrB-like protein